LKPVKLNQLLFEITPPCLSIYVPDAASFEALHVRIEQRLEKHPHLQEIYRKELLSIREVLKRHPEDPCGFYLSNGRKGYLPLDHDTAANFVVGESFYLGPVLEELFGNPEYALVILAEAEMRLYRGDSRQVELLERHEFNQHPGPQLVYGQGATITPSQRRGIKEWMLRLHQMAALARLPVVVAGQSELVKQFATSFRHPYGVVKLDAPHFTELTCPQLLQEFPKFKGDVVEYHAENFKMRLRTLVRTGRIVSELAALIRAVHEGKVMRLLLPEKRRLWGSVNMQTGHYEIMGLHQVEGSVDIIEEVAEATIRQGGKIQFLPEHFFPHGSHAMVVMRGEFISAHTPVFGVATNPW